MSCQCKNIKRLENSWNKYGTYLRDVRGVLANLSKVLRDVRGTFGKFADAFYANLRGPLYANLRDLPAEALYANLREVLPALYANLRDLRRYLCKFVRFAS